MHFFVVNSSFANIESRKCIKFSTRKPFNFAYYNPNLPSKKYLYPHRNASCVGCNEDKIKGIRYLCANCTKNVSFCENCLAKIDSLSTEFIDKEQILENAKKEYHDPHTHCYIRILYNSMIEINCKPFGQEFN